MKIKIKFIHKTIFCFVASVIMSLGIYFSGMKTVPMAIEKYIGPCSHEQAQKVNDSFFPLRTIYIFIFLMLMEPFFRIFRIYYIEKGDD